jgi:hypothetical protein
LFSKTPSSLFNSQSWYDIPSPLSSSDEFFFLSLSDDEIPIKAAQKTTEKEELLYAKQTTRASSAPMLFSTT